MFPTIKTAMRIYKNEGFLSLVGKSITFISQIFLLPYHILLVYSHKNDSFEQVLDFVYSDKGSFIRPAQIKSEIGRVLSKIVEIKPKLIMELGTGKGGNFFLLCKAAPFDSKLISLDMRGGVFGGGYPIWKLLMFKFFKKGEQKLIFVRQDSHNLHTLSIISKICNGQNIDFLFIDGDHTYEGVKKDFEMYSSLVKKNGIIALHDILPSKYKLCTVSKFWNEIKSKYKNEEIFEDKKQGWAGIGVIYKK